jgi:hypothetical protein
MNYLAVKDLEKRWGLTVVSFLPHSVHGLVRSLQDRLLLLVYPNGEHIERRGEPAIELYSGTQLHCTHLTLARSNGWGPVREADLVKPGRDLFALYQAILEVASYTSPMEVELTRLKVSAQDNSILLLGQCTGESIGAREGLLSGLNSSLPDSFYLSRRNWDTDAARYKQVHCRLGFIKRPLLNAEEFSKAVDALDLAPLTCTLDHIVLVHHRYRSLLTPHDGIVNFRLGASTPKPLTRDEFARALCLQ